MSDLHNVRILNYSTQLNTLAKALFAQWSAGIDIRIHSWQALKCAIEQYGESILPYLTNRGLMLAKAENRPLATSIKLWQAADAILYDWHHGHRPTASQWLLLHVAISEYEALFSLTKYAPPSAADDINASLSVQSV